MALRIRNELTKLDFLAIKGYLREKSSFRRLSCRKNENIKNILLEKEERMKAVKISNLAWGEIKIPVKVISLIKEKPKIPVETEIHRICNQQLIEEDICPNCGKPLQVKDFVICPNCREIFEPDSVETLCRECSVAVNSNKVKRVKWCPKCDRKVVTKEVKQVFPVDDKDKFVEITKNERNEWKKLLPGENDIEIRYPIHRGGISPIYFEAIYGLIPNLDKAKESYRTKFWYSLFREILQDRKLALVVDLFIKKKYHRALIMYERKILVLITLIEEDRITWPEIPGPEIDLPLKQVGIAKEGIRRMVRGRFQSKEDARDPYYQYFQALVERKKVERKKVSFKPPVSLPPQIIKEVTEEIERTLRDKNEGIE